MRKAYHMEDLKVPMLTRIYLAAFTIILTLIAIIAISVAITALDIRTDVNKIHLLLRDDNEWVDIPSIYEDFKKQENWENFGKEK